MMSPPLRLKSPGRAPKPADGWPDAPPHQPEAVGDGFGGDGPTAWGPRGGGGTGLEGAGGADADGGSACARVRGPRKRWTRLMRPVHEVGEGPAGAGRSAGGKCGR